MHHISRLALGIGTLLCAPLLPAQVRCIFSKQMPTAAFEYRALVLDAL